MNKIKVLYIANQFDYGYASWGDSYEKMHWYDTFKNMDNVDLHLFDYMQELNQSDKQTMSKKLIEYFEDVKPDFVFCNFMELNTDPDFDSIQYMTNQNCNTFFWSSDDRMRYQYYSNIWARHFKWMGTMYEPAVAWYHRDGFGAKCIRTEYASNHYNFKPMDIEQKYDVVFIGQTHSDRKDVIKRIESEGINIKTFGRGWGENSKLKTCEEYVEAINSAKIVLNLVTSSCGNYKQINGRFFEIPMCNTLLITGETEDNSKKYFNDNEVVYYKNYNDMIDKIKYFLENEKEAKEIAQNGYQKAIKNHTYEVRFNEIFRKVGLK